MNKIVTHCGEHEIGSLNNAVTLERIWGRVFYRSITEDEFHDDLLAIYLLPYRGDVL